MQMVSHRFARPSNKRSRFRPHPAFYTLFSIAIFVSPGFADIFRWDNNQLIPGTEGIVPGPGIRLAEFQLQYANLSSANLFDSTLNNSHLSFALFSDSDLSFTQGIDADLTNTDFTTATSSLRQL